MENLVWLAFIVVMISAIFLATPFIAELAYRYAEWVRRKWFLDK